MDRLGLTGLVHPLSVVNGLIIRDNIDINIPRQTGELIHQGTAFEQRRCLVIGAADHNLRDTADPGIFRNLHSRVIAIDSGNLRTQLFCQPQIIPQPPEIFAGELPGFGRFHKQGCKTAVERLCHPGSCAQHLGIGR